jgi:hypothetical protein
MLGKLLLLHHKLLTSLAVHTVKCCLSQQDIVGSLLMHRCMEGTLIGFLPFCWDSLFGVLMVLVCGFKAMND